MKLSQGEKGKMYKVISLNMSREAIRRFEVLGMTMGTNITLVNIAYSKAMIIKLRGTRFAVGKNFCEQIEVEAVNE